MKDKETHGEFWGNRSTTIRNEYIKVVLGNRIRELDAEYYAKFDIDITKCAYCGKDATGIDHIYSPINEAHFSGYTNEIKNLLPACSRCNSSKGKKDWKEWIYSNSKVSKEIRKDKEFKKRVERIENYIKKNKTKKDKIPDDILEKLNKRCDEFNKRIEEMDKIAKQHRDKYLADINSKNKKSKKEVAV